MSQLKQLLTKLFLKIDRLEVGDHFPNISHNKGCCCFNLKLNNLRGGEYLSQLIEFSDTLTIDGRINTIISGTNRVGSNTLKVATLYQQLLQKKGIKANLLSLTQVNFLVRDAAFEKIENELLIPTSKFLFITPEYNGSFPGALKMLIDTSK